jgi:hypothetical protein
MGRALDLTGQRFGKLTVVELLGSIGTDRYWYCKCDCGAETMVRTNNLTRLHTKSCGCLNKESASLLTNQKFGRLTAVKCVGQTPNKVNLWQCNCSCGTSTTVSVDKLRSGKTKSCGCLNKETTRTTGRNNWKHGGTTDHESEYMAWKNLKSRPKEWNDFSQFLKDVGTKPEGMYRLCKKDGYKQHGKNNTYWRNTNDENQQSATDLGSDFVLDLRGFALAEAAKRARESAA